MTDTAADPSPLDPAIPPLTRFCLRAGTIPLPCLWAGFTEEGGWRWGGCLISVPTPSAKGSNGGRLIRSERAGPGSSSFVFSELKRARNPSVTEGRHKTTFEALACLRVSSAGACTAQGVGPSDYWAAAKPASPDLRDHPHSHGGLGSSC